MKPLLTAIVSALVGAAVAALGIAVIAIPAVLMWLVSFEAAADPLVFVAGVGGSWLLGHGVPLEVHLTAEAAFGLGGPPEPVTMGFSLPMLGIMALTIIGALQAGWRAAMSVIDAVAGVIAAITGFGLVAAAITGLSQPLLATTVPSAVAATVAVFAGAAVSGAVARGVRDHDLWNAHVHAWFETRGAGSLATWIAEGSRLLAAILVGLCALSATLFAVAVVLHFTDIIALSESLQPDIVGFLLLAFAQFLLLPTALLWSLAWVSGAGFRVGVGTLTSPFDQVLGPIPAVPLFGAIPETWGSAALLAPALVVVTALVIGAIWGGSAHWRELRWWQTGAVLVGLAGIAGVIVTALTGLAHGSFGPARLREVGPQAWDVGGMIAIEVALGLLAGVLARRLDVYWVSPLRKAVSTRVTEAKIAREREWSQLGKPETFRVHDAKRASLSAPLGRESDEDRDRAMPGDDTVEGIDTADEISERDRERALVAEFETVSLDDLAAKPISRGATPAESADDDADPHHASAAGAAVTPFVASEGDSQNVTEPLADIGWFDDLQDHDRRALGESHDEGRGDTGHETRPVTRGHGETHHLPELTDPDEIVKSFAWDSGMAATGSWASRRSRPGTGDEPSESSEDTPRTRSPLRRWWSDRISRD